MSFFSRDDASVLIKLVWPAERVVAGLRVCKNTRSVLQNEAVEVLLRCSWCKHLSDLHQPKIDAARDLQRLQHCTLDVHIASCGTLMNQFASGLKLAQEAGWSGVLRTLSFRMATDRLSYDTIAAVLSRCPALKHLDLSCNPTEGFGRVADVLSRLTALTELHLEEMVLSQPSVDQIGDALGACTALRVLSLQGTFITPSLGHFTTLAGLPFLEQFTNHAPYLQSSGEPSYEQLLLPPTLCHLDLGNHHIPMDWLRTVIGGLTSLRTLALWSCNIEDIGALHMAQIISQCSHITNLNLGRNGIGVDGGVELGRELRHAAQLVCLDLSQNRIDGSALQLHGCTGLTRLMMHGNSMGAEGGQQLLSSMAAGRLPALSCLSLSNNPCFGGGHPRLIAQALRSCPLLEILDLASTELADDDAAHLAAGLSRCPALCALDLRSNSVGGVGAVEIGVALRACTRLHTLNLSFNPIGAAGLRRFMRNLRPEGCRCLLLLAETARAGEHALPDSVPSRFTVSVDRSVAMRGVL